MKFKIRENIYSGNTNNKINKKKYKHATSPFCKMNAGNVEFNVNSFNHAMGDTSSDTFTASIGEALDILNEENLNDDSISFLVGTWIGDLYIPEVNDKGVPYLPKEFWEDWD